MKHHERQAVCLRVVEEDILISKYCIWQFNCHCCGFSQWLDNTAGDAAIIPAGTGYSSSAEIK